MNTPVARRWWIAFGASVVALFALLAVRMVGVPGARQFSGSLPELRSEHARLSGFTLEALAALRREYDLLLTPGSSGEALPIGWTHHGENGTARYRYGSDSPLSWPELLRVVSHVEQISGGRIVALDIRSRGSRDKREIATVEITVGAPATLRPQPDAASPGADGSPRARKVGRVRSLRRPSASADRLAARLRLPALAPLALVPTLRARASDCSIPLTALDHHSS